VLILDDSAVRRALDMPAAISAIERALEQQARGEVAVGERQNLRYEGGWLRLMPCALLGEGYVGYKSFHLGSDGVRYSCHLFDAHRGVPIALMDANFLTQIRTGAAGGVALKRMAPSGSVRAGLIGAGAEARTQLEALAAVRPVSGARVFSPRSDRRARFAREMSQKLGIPIEPSATPAAALADADVVLVATNTGLAGATALEGAWLHEGQHVNSIGSTMPEQRELHHGVWSVIDWVVLDTRGLLRESGDAIAALEQGTLRDTKVIELVDLVHGAHTERKPTDITLYKSVGTALQDIAVACAAFVRASELGLGTHIADFHSVKELHA